jgi:hypothetical protein
VCLCSNKALFSKAGSWSLDWFVYPHYINTVIEKTIVVLPTPEAFPGTRIQTQIINQQHGLRNTDGE